MDTGTMVVTGNNWDIINDIIDTEYDMSVKHRKVKNGDSKYCACSSANYFEDPKEFPDKDDINAYFEDPKQFPDKRDINNYFESFEGYPLVMNDPNIISLDYTGEKLVKFFSSKNVLWLILGLLALFGLWSMFKPSKSKS